MFIKQTHISKNMTLAMAKSYFCLYVHTLDICCLVHVLLQVQVGTSSNEFPSMSNFRKQQHNECIFGI